MGDELVNLGDVMAAAAAVKDDGPAAVDAIAQREPFLAGFVAGQIKQVAGELALGGAPPVVVRKVANEMASLAAVVADAMTRGSYRTWVGSVPADSPLAREGLITTEPKTAGGSNDGAQ